MNKWFSEDFRRLVFPTQDDTNCLQRNVHCYDAEGLKCYKQPVFYLFPVRKINQVLKVSQFAKVEVVRVYMIPTGLIFSSTSDSELIFPIRASVPQLQSRTADVSCYHPANDQFVVVGGSQDPRCVF